MRLYLSSYRLGAFADRLATLIRGANRACIIANALDYISDEERRACAARGDDPVAEFASRGIDADHLDLRDWFGTREGLAATLRRYDLVWATGGDAFLPIQAMRLSGFDRIVRTLLDRDQLVYAASAPVPSSRGRACAQSIASTTLRSPRPAMRRRPGGPGCRWSTSRSCRTFGPTIRRPRPPKEPPAG